MLSVEKLQDLLQKDLNAMLEASEGAILYDEQTGEEEEARYDDRGIATIRQTQPDGTERDIQLMVKVQIL